MRLPSAKSAHRHPVIEAPAERQDQVGVAQGIVGRDGAVHAGHAQVVGVIEGDRPQGVEGGGDRHIEALGEAAQGRGGAGMNDARRRP